MSTDIATLGLEVETSPLVRARDELGRFTKGASAAERAAQSWGTTTSAAARQVSASVAPMARARDEFGRFVKGAVTSNEAISRSSMATVAGMTRTSMATVAGMRGQAADFSSVVAAMAARLANDNQVAGASFAELATNVTTGATRMRGAVKVAEDVGRGLGGMIMGVVRIAAPLAAIFTAAGLAMKVWGAGMKAADIGEQAEQLNVSTEALQAYRYEAAQAGIADGQLDQALIRLTASLGAAYKGGEEQIKMFDKLGVKVLDANGELRATQDILPELAVGLKNLGSETQRNAILTELFGRSGSRMVTMLDAWAKGNEVLIASAKKSGAILDNEAIKAWDDLSDAMKRASAIADTAFARLGAPIATWALEKVEALLKSIVANLDRLKTMEATTQSRAAQVDVSNLEERLAALRQNPTQFGFKNSEAALIRQIEERKQALESAKAQERQIAMQADEETARSVKLPPSVPPPIQATPKGSGKEDPYSKIISGARTYIAQKEAETQALALNGLEASRLIHTQELLNKATEAGIRITAAQRAELTQLAEKMAQADMAFKTSEFMKNAQQNSDKFIRDKELERQAIGMSAEAAAKMRYEQDMLNQAQAANITLTQEQRAEIEKMAGAMASAEEKTRRASEMYEFSKGTFKGLMSDINQGIREGAGVWDILGNAATNALGKISDKLMEMAADQLWEAAFPKGGGGSGGSGGGILDLFGGLFGGGSSGTSGGLFDGIMGLFNFFPTFAKGGVFDKRGLVPFARGGIVERPTVFPFSKGTGIMGEAGPEAIMPLRRGRNGSLGVVANGVGGAGSGNGGTLRVYVDINNDVLEAKIDNQSSAIVRKAAPSIEARAVEKAGDRVVPIVQRDKEQGHGDWRTR